MQCAAMTRKGIRCRKDGTKSIAVGGRRAIVCGTHYGTFEENGGITIAPRASRVIRSSESAEQQVLKTNDNRKRNIMIKCGNCRGRHTSVQEVRKCCGTTSTTEERKVVPQRHSNNQERVVTVTCKVWADGKATTHPYEGTIQEVKGQTQCSKHRS